MSDQVEMVAAEDAASNAEGSANAVTEQPGGEQPQAPVAAETAEVTDAPAASEAVTPDQPTVEQPVVPVASEVAEAADAPAAQEPVDSQASDEAADTESVAVEAPAAQEPIDSEASGEAAVAEPVAVEAPVAQEVVDTADEAAEAAPVAEDTGEVAAEASAEPAVEAEVDAADDSEGGKSNVRILAVGQEVVGNVKRIADFGAFIDIGVGRDGLIHISELSVRRVGKVTDVLTEGQEITAWIKKLDRDRNRISLTLIDPNTKTIRDLNAGDIVQGTVTRILPYGAFVDIGIGRDALLHVREMAQGYVAKPEDVVKPGDTIEARIIELSRRRGRVDLSLKGLGPEPEPAPPSQAYSQPNSQSQSQSRTEEPAPEPEVDDSFADVEVLSPMELAFKRAMEAEGVEFKISKKKQGKRNRRERDSDLQDDIFSRTLQSGRK